MHNIVGNRDAIEQLTSIMALPDKIIPNHIIIEGPSGVGKRTAALSFARAMAPSKFQDQYLHVVSASRDAHSTSVVNDGLLAVRTHVGNLAPHRILVILNAHFLCEVDQRYLLQLLKSNHSVSIRVVFVCNTVDDGSTMPTLCYELDAMCEKVVFQALQPQDISTIILAQKDLKMTSQAVEELSTVVGGNVHKLMQELTQLRMARYGSGEDGAFTVDDVRDIIRYLIPMHVRNVVTLSGFNGTFREAMRHRAFNAPVAELTSTIISAKDGMGLSGFALSAISGIPQQNERIGNIVLRLALAHVDLENLI